MNVKKLLKPAKCGLFMFLKTSDFQLKLTYYLILQQNTASESFEYLNFYVIQDLFYLRFVHQTASFKKKMMILLERLLDND